MVFLFIPLLLAAEPPADPPYAELDACGLIEGLPGPEDPLRSASPFAAAFRLMDSAGDDTARQSEAHARFARELRRLLARAEKIFRAPGGGRSPNRAAEQAFLQRYVLGRTPVLRVGDAGFEARPPIRAALASTACRAGENEAAIAWARRVPAGEDDRLLAFAALLLIRAGRIPEARELAGAIGDRGFLAAWVQAEVATAPDLRRQHHAKAARRAATSSQKAAIAAQKRRWGLP